MPQILFAFILSSVLALSAGTNGQISGRITDWISGNELPGVEIRIDQIGVLEKTDRHGKYLFKNLAPGRYTLHFSEKGYQNKTLKDVLVIADSVTTVDVRLVAVSTGQQPKFHKMATTAEVARAGELLIPVEPVPIDWNTEEYEKINESGYFDVLDKPLSTFAADVDAASYANARRFILQDQLPYKDVVRSEEFINYFDYDYQQPEAGQPLSINLEYGECPWNSGHRLVHIGLQSKLLKKQDQKPSNLVFLLDVSGSMDDPKKLPLLKQAFRLLTEQLSSQDKVSIVVYAGNAGLVLPATPGSAKTVILDALERLQAGGSTAGGEGIQLAYRVARDNFINKGNNRVILATDGDFNVGISSTSELTRFIEARRDEGIFLTILGFGMGNYKDHRLQELADRGNGHHAYIDNILEARKVLVNEITATLYTIARDVKIQVEFNPAQVQSYRLIGYENRRLEDKDFKDDTKDAGEIGAGHTVTALYEIIPAGAAATDNTTDLKYQDRVLKPGSVNNNEILTVKIRYKEPEGGSSKEFSDVLSGQPKIVRQSSENFRFSAAVAEFAMILRDSEFKGSSNLKQVKELAGSAMGTDPFGYRAEFLTLVDRVTLLMKPSQED